MSNVNILWTLKFLFIAKKSVQKKKNQQMWTAVTISIKKQTFTLCVNVQEKNQTQTQKQKTNKKTWIDTIQTPNFWRGICKYEMCWRYIYMCYICAKGFFRFEFWLSSYLQKNCIIFFLQEVAPNLTYSQNLPFLLKYRIWIKIDQLFCPIDFVARTYLVFQ